MAIEATGISLAIANEGSFNTHPTIFFAHADDEIIMLLDKENGIEIIERELSLKTNSDGGEIKSENELIEFANKIGFPSHGIILKKGKNNYFNIIKESRTLDELIKNYHKIKIKDGTAYAETDMRAMNNPTRMKIIEQVALKLVNKVKLLCPNCNTPVFGVVDTVKGLPCGVCGLRTRSTLKHIYRCQKCNFQKGNVFPINKQVEAPQYCDFCNP